MAPTAVDVDDARQTMVSSLFAGRSVGPLYVSHRGFQPLAPENSIPAFAYAGLFGQWAVETDVRMTRDGVLVCCHDASIDSMYDASGEISGMTWSELSSVRVARGNRRECFLDEELRMPRFDEYLEICRRHGSVPFIELKVPVADRVMAEVERAGFGEEDVVVSATDMDWLEAARASAPHVFLHHIFGSFESAEHLASLGEAGLSFNVPDPTLISRSDVDRVHAMGVRLCLRAGDSRDSVVTMQELGVDYIPTNTMHGEVTDTHCGHGRR